MAVGEEPEPGQPRRLARTTNHPDLSDANHPRLPFHRCTMKRSLCNQRERVKFGADSPLERVHISCFFTLRPLPLEDDLMGLFSRKPCITRSSPLHCPRHRSHFSFLPHAFGRARGSAARPVPLLHPEDDIVGLSVLLLGRDLYSAASSYSAIGGQVQMRFRSP